MRCPVCKAENAQGPQCRRCKADLTLLFRLEDQREREVHEARRRLRRGEWREALRHAEAADWLRQGDDSRRLRAAAHLLGREFTAAWQCYRALTS
jgi:hypothetical protein